MSKATFIVIPVALICSLLNGCNKGQSARAPASDVQQRGFPQFLVGTWKADDARWVFTFDPNGQISKMTHYVGMEFVVAEGGLMEEGRDGAKATYVLGPCEAKYNPDTRRLDVTVTIEHFRMEFGNGAMEGSFFDNLTGPVSADDKVWRASWMATSEIIDSGSGTDGPKLLTFTKVADANTP